MLNPSQQAGVDHRGTPLLLLAGAGTGKTRVITHRVASLMEEGVRPWEILAVTFTNRAAAEMRERIDELCRAREAIPDFSPRDLWVGTFHAICARILRTHGAAIGLSPRFTIYDSDDQKTLMRNVLKDMQAAKEISPGLVLGHVDKAKNRGFGPRELNRLELEEPLLSTVQVAWEHYERRCRAADACDFGDLLVLTVRLLMQAKLSVGEGSQLADFDPVLRLCRRFCHVVVDEYQDTNPIQARLVELLSESAQLCVVGDDDQAIYGWRGADVAQILGFPDRHEGTEVIRLEQNYRSTSHILHCADCVIRRNESRHGKTLWSDLGDGELVRVACLADEKKEAQFAAQWIQRGLDDGASVEDFAIFYRTHAQSRAIEEGLRRANIDYRIVGGTRFFDRREIKDLVAYLRLLVSPNSDLDVLRIINVPRRGIGKKTIEGLQSIANTHEISLFEAMERIEESTLGPAAKRKVMGFHALLSEFRTLGERESPGTVAEEILEKIAYHQHLTTFDDDGVQAETRLENLQEFVGSLTEFGNENPESGLPEYLEEVSLATSAENVQGEDAVTLMTVHSAKGLEFERVIICGLEERIFPHVRSLEDRVQMEEERRLAYVAVTRAKRQLLCTYTESRWLFGQTQVNRPSRFVGDFPEASISQFGTAPRARMHSRRQGGATAFGDRDPLGGENHQGARDDTRWNSDIELDEDVAEASASEDREIQTEEGDGVALYVGMNVRHRKFGTGSVLAWSGQGKDMKLTLSFTGYGTKQILARFCEPLR